MLHGMTISVSAAHKKDSLILDRIYAYQQAHTSAIDSLEDQVYAKFRYHVDPCPSSVPRKDAACVHVAPVMSISAVSLTVLSLYHVFAWAFAAHASISPGEEM